MNKKLVLITNLILVSLFSIVCLVSFVPEKAVPIYGGKQVQAIYHGDRANKNISLMFNVYENSQVVNKIVDLLDSYNAKATFFVGGCWADDNGEVLNKIVSSGHEIANHGYFHKDHKKLDYKANLEEIRLTSAIIKALCGAKPTLFAPPSGSFSTTTLEVCFDLNYKLIMWSKDTIDWRDNDLDLIFNRATKNIENGDLILMHPKEHTLKILPKILKHFDDLGFEMVSVSQNINEKE